MVRYGLFDESEEEMLRNVLCFTGNRKQISPEGFELIIFGRISARQINRDFGTQYFARRETVDLEIGSTGSQEIIFSLS